MNPETLSGLLQFSDGLFPAGGYAHSFGLETYVQAGTIRSMNEVTQFIRAHLEGSVGPCDAVAVVAALALARAEDRDGCLALDTMLDAIKPAAEFREASRQMGRQSLRVAISLIADPFIQSFAHAVEANSTPGHHALVFGLIGAAMSWSAEEAAQGYLYSSTSLLVGAALRLLPIGQLDGQKIIWEMRPVMQKLAREALDKTVNDLWSFSPGIEISGMKHASLDARLFRS